MAQDPGPSGCPQLPQGAGAREGVEVDAATANEENAFVNFIPPHSGQRVRARLPLRSSFSKR